MSDLTELDIKLRIIRKLVKWKKWGGAHTEHITDGLPSHLKGAKITKEVIRELVKDEWLLIAKKTNEIHYFLNSKKTKEIYEFYRKYSNKE